MNNKQLKQLAPQMASAVEELITMIRTHYPDAQFELLHGVDEPESIHLTAIVDINDGEDVTDLIIERLLEFQVEERLPIHVIPLRPIESVIAATQPSIAHVTLAKRSK